MWPRQEELDRDRAAVGIADPLVGPLAIDELGMPMMSV